MLCFKQPSINWSYRHTNWYTNQVLYAFNLCTLRHNQSLPWIKHCKLVMRRIIWVNSIELELNNKPTKSHVWLSIGAWCMWPPIVAQSEWTGQATVRSLYCSTVENIHLITMQVTCVHYTTHLEIDGWSILKCLIECSMLCHVQHTQIRHAVSQVATFFFYLFGCRLVFY